MSTLDAVVINLPITVREADMLARLLVGARKSIDPFDAEELGTTYSLYSRLNKKLLLAYIEVDVLDYENHEAENFLGN